MTAQNARLTRQPTISEAIEIITKQTITRKQKFAHIWHWRRLYGDEFADQVMDNLRAKKKNDSKA